MADFTVKSSSDIRDDFLRTYRAGLVGIGVKSPNVSQGTDTYILAQAIGDQIEVAMANAQVKADEVMPDTATGDELDGIANNIGMPERRGAVGGAGSVILTSTAKTTVTVGAELVDQAGFRFRVLTGGVYASGDTIPIEALDTGAATNHPAGDVFRWVQPPPFSDSKATVATGGITGGSEAEDDETLRQRIFDWLRNPPAAGNAAHVALLAEQADAIVQKAFVYPGVAGSGSLAVAVVGYPSDTSKGRKVTDAVVANSVKPYIDGLYPEGVSTIVTSVDEVPFDVSMAIAIPSSPKARPPGPGGGWTDGATWPKNINGASDFKSSVLNVTTNASVTYYTVQAPSMPIAGVTQIAWLSPYTWQVYTATVMTAEVVGYLPNISITLDKPLPGITVGCLISPNATNIETYFDAIIQAFAALGPGEKLASDSPLYGRGFRHPPPAQSWPYRVDAAMLRAVVVSSDEVQDAAFLFRTQATAPDVPASLSAAPKIYIPRHIALYEAV